jgi:hypothetical protein
MNKKLVAAGCVGALVALGFVCPQVAQIRMNGVLGPAGILLLLLGITGTIAGLWCVAKGVMHRPSTPSS